MEETEKQMFMDMLIKGEVFESIAQKVVLHESKAQHNATRGCLW